MKRDAAAQRLHTSLGPRPSTALLSSERPDQPQCSLRVVRAALHRRLAGQRDVLCPVITPRLSETVLRDAVLSDIDKVRTVHTDALTPLSR